MEHVVDLHVHSRYARATSKNCDFESMYYWAKLKGIHIIGTGDFTHPEWFSEMREKLESAEPGLLRLKPEFAGAVDAKLPPIVRDQTIRYIPSSEIATIYKKADKVRKLHQLIIMPSLEAVSTLNSRLERLGANLKSDGRPIIGLDSKELLRMALEADARALYIPAHIWTPWFGMFGSKSGFDMIQEAYEELSPEIRAIETGLSSDPFMNWRVKNLDGLAITSSSDAHSPQKLGREATLISADYSYDDIIGAIKTNDERLVGTIEFFPEEGMYHSDGHRACGVRFTPAETEAADGVCPACEKPVVMGVQNRVQTLAANDRPDNFLPSKSKKVEYIIPLAEILAELRGVKTISSKAVQADYHEVISRLGDEFNVLRNVPIEAISEAGFPVLALAIERLRSGNVVRDPGYDGVYGTIRVFKDAIERVEISNQLSLL